MEIRQWGWVAAMAVFAGLPCCAQEPYTVTAKAYEVKLVFSASNHLGSAVDDLVQADLAVTDDGKPQHDITHFERRTSLPLRAGILVDTSRSMMDVAQRNQEIIRLFATKILRGESDQAFLSEFDFDRIGRADWTADPAVLEKASTQLGRGSGSRLGGTALYDSVYRTVREQFQAQPERTDGTANLLLLFSDGDDNVSHAFLRDVVDLCQATQTRIYVFSANPKAKSDDGEKHLRLLASLTGGRIFYDESPATALVDLRMIEADLRNSYVLAYKPSHLKQDGKFHALKLDAPAFDVAITTRGGYFAPGKAK
jgi:VWFA-related protein